MEDRHALGEPTGDRGGVVAGNPDRAALGLLRMVADIAAKCPESRAEEGLTCIEAMISDWRSYLP